MSDPDLVDEVVTITLSAAGGGYTNVPNKTVSVVTWDITANRSIVLETVPVDIDENGTDRPFGFRLNRIPFSNVDVRASSSHANVTFPDGNEVTFHRIRDGWDDGLSKHCLLYTSPSPRDRTRTRMPSSA